uniref:PPM-type phosphatase domain-containing protein n=1 Tax=Strongyloides venezuelensis TaxID=75913 RepID=A0A0K0G6A1_STRVS
MEAVLKKWSNKVGLNFLKDRLSTLSNSYFYLLKTEPQCQKEFNKLLVAKDSSDVTTTMIVGSSDGNKIIARRSDSCGKMITLTSA